MNNDQLLHFIKRYGVSLEPLGLNEFAFQKEHACKYIQMAVDMKKPILGGDVYHRFGNKIKPSYDNWYCTSYNGETSEAFLKRSREESIEYIKNYPITKHFENIFIVVI